MVYGLGRWSGTSIAHERAVRKRAMTGLLNAVWRRQNLIYNLVNLYFHVVPVIPTFLQGSFIDRAWRWIESCLLKK